ncbi:MAG: ABC transporter permease [Bacteroidota bacterium]
MMGKIVGVGFVGLLQFIIKVVLTILLLFIIKSLFFPELTLNPTEKLLVNDLMTGKMQQAEIVQQVNSSGLKDIFTFIEGIDFTILIGSFIVFFILGYLLYASLFAAVGASLDHDTDTQQFVLPITLPLLFSIFLVFITIMSPDHPLSFWFSIFPLTSPIVMMSRIPFGVPYWQIWVAIGLLVITFIATTWMAGKIYRTGILMYGKRVSYRELWKWIRY